MDNPPFEPLLNTQRTISASGDRIVSFTQFRNPANGRYVSRNDVIFYPPGYLLAESRRILLPGVTSPELLVAA